MAADQAPSPQALGSALVEEVASVLGALLGSRPGMTPATAPVVPTWIVTVRSGASTRYAISLGMSSGDGRELARLVTGMDVAPDESAVRDMLQEVVGQAVGALRETPLGRDLRLSLDAAVEAIGSPEGQHAGYLLAVSPDFTPAIGTWAATGASAGARPHEAGSGEPTRPAATTPRTTTEMPANLDVILDIDLPLSVRFGQTDMTLDALTNLGPGSIIDLGRSPDDPVDVLVNGKLVARAEVVVVGGNYGIRILEVVSAADRVRTLRA